MMMGQDVDDNRLMLHQIKVPSVLYHLCTETSYCFVFVKLHCLLAIFI